VENDERLAVSLAVNSGEDIELHLLVLNGQGEIIRSGDYRIANAALIAGADPVMAVDKMGRSLFTVLHTSDQGAALVRTRIVFGPDAIPLMMEGSGRERLCELPSPVEEGTIVASGEPVQWATGWCVITVNGQMLRGRSNARFEIAELPRGLIRPIVAVGDRHNLGVAVQKQSGILAFA
jgi:hypothetical protein